ncbi:rubredoxin [Methanoregula sp.]|uniref:rubredoxin n=1 Tax=Methanoregula sp. TaxID=2052170 RepID=UPI000CC9C3B5|nr:rubredoxin [Methanoregula sp.]PKG32324.1 MAG: rubredoxin [Methanoregula sp.]
MAKTGKPGMKGGAKKTAKTVAVAKKPAARVTKKPAAAKKTLVKKSPAKTVVVKKKPAVKPAKKVAAKKTPVVKKTAKKPAAKDMTRYRCKLCGYIYSPMRGEPHNGIPEGTPFDELPESYVCPVCGQQGKGRIGKWGFDEWRPTRYLCSLCNYVYDEKRGEPHRGIRPGTKFDDLPDDYSCPVCAIDPKIRVRFGKVFKHGFEPLNY